MVTFVLMPSEASCLTAIKPSFMTGTLTTTFSAIAASLRPSSMIVSARSVTVSRLTGPSTSSQISG